MPHYNILQAFWLSLYSRAFYRDVAQNWRGRSFLYMLLLALITSLAFLFIFHKGGESFITSLQPTTQNLPTITIKNGEASIKQAQPYFVKNSQAQIVGIIDTTGQYTSLENNSAYVLLTKDTFWYRNYDGEVKSQLIAHNVKDGIYNAPGISHLLRRIMYWILTISFGLLFGFFFFIAILQALIYSGLTKLFLETSLDYNALLSIAAVALTGQFLLFSLLNIIGYLLPYHWVAYILLAIGYLVYGVTANRNH